MFRAGAHHLVAGILSRLAHFRRDRRAVAAVEFAFIAPILLIMYFITMEAAQAIETSKKVSRLGSMVADLVAQQDNVSKSVLKNIMQIGETTLRPYTRSVPGITITAIKISNDAAANPTVSWSYKVANGTYGAGDAKGSSVSVPPTLKIAGTFLVKVESTLGYKPVIAWAVDGNQPTGLTGIFNNITMSETYYLRPRVMQEINCSDC
jgi:Flp pilus assembly protein TadG